MLYAYCSCMILVRRCETEADERVSLEIYNAVWPREPVTMDEVRSFQAQARAWADHLAYVDGEPVGSGFVAARSERPELPFTLLTVLPSTRARGAGSALYRAVSTWADHQGATELEAVVEEDDTESLAFAARRSFVETERNGRMVLDLGFTEPASARPPEGIEIITWAERPELAPGIYEVYAEVMPDIPGQEADKVPPYDDWLGHHMRGTGDRPDATFVALARDQVVGYAKFSFNAAQPAVAFHDLTGVRRAWRGRGIAGALKRSQIAWARQEGYAELRTQNEMRNEPIRRLNERLGYRLEPGRVFLRGPVAPRRIVNATVVP